MSVSDLSKWVSSQATPCFYSDYALIPASLAIHSQTDSSARSSERVDVANTLLHTANCCAIGPPSNIPTPPVAPRPAPIVAAVAVGWKWQWWIVWGKIDAFHYRDSRSHKHPFAYTLIGSERERENEINSRHVTFNSQLLVTPLLRPLSLSLPPWGKYKSYPV